MSKSILFCILGIFVLTLSCVLVWVFVSGETQPLDIWAEYQKNGKYPQLTIQYPLDGTLFPPEIIPPTFRWQDSQTQSDTWLIAWEKKDNANPRLFLVKNSSWSPPTQDWEIFKQKSMETPAKVTILGLDSQSRYQILSAASVSIQTSRDRVDAPIFYREVNLPFREAVKDPSKIRWRFGAIGSAEPPPIVMQNLPVCGNCHSFTRDGSTMAMDVDYANSKGSYVITRTAEEMELTTSDIITWNDYKREDNKQTFGLLSQISPDGRYVVSTVKDKSVFIPQPNLAYSQLFFPIKGILAVYDRLTKTFYALPGADDPAYVQSNPTWSPDGKCIVFARTRMYELKHALRDDRVLMTPEECREFLKDGKLFPFDLYRIPFNDGKGGKPEPLEGASENGMSNYFAKYSPDGKWIVFCRAKSFMLLQPDSQLYIIPAHGGPARRLRCNTSRMNSWHSFAHNGRWLVFSSKENGPYTQLFLTHIDEQGFTTPPVELSHFTAPDRAANIPEFVNLEANAIKIISENFLDDYSFVRAGNEFFKKGDSNNAIAKYLEALKYNPNNFEAHLKLGFLFYNVKKSNNEGMTYYTKALKLEPKDPRIHHDLGMALLHQRQYDQAVKYLSNALEGMPRGLDKQYNLVGMHHNLGLALYYQGKANESALHLTQALQLEPQRADLHYDLARTLAVLGKIQETVAHYQQAISLNPLVDISPELHQKMAANYAHDGQYAQARSSAEKALLLALTRGDNKLAQEIQIQMENYSR
jgi:tetratricopeptide (TPR) repeat protein